jgi:hypothetical protein
METESFSGMMDACTLEVMSMIKRVVQGCSNGLSIIEIRPGGKRYVGSWLDGNQHGKGIYLTGFG